MSGHGNESEEPEDIFHVVESPTDHVLSDLGKAMYANAST